ncbi:hypothetical protein GCM10023340_14500 [Nocardioides marinquilinus]|uniref:Tellurium resistance n=1 Tax=Nocardioides marinquilinus TaxID=1210400 RepID=A0ABP9PJG1_9ACTN
MVDLNKVQLTKASPTVNLAKGAGAGGRMRVNLNWDQSAGAGQKGGLFGRKKSGGIDLDLAALWETTDGSKGVVQALGNSFGSLDTPPYVFLDGDDRSGTNTEGENLLINLDHLGQLRRVLVFAFIYEGAPAWADANGVVTLYPQGAAPIEIRLDEANRSARTCAIALLTPQDGGLTVNREVRYINGFQQDLDQAYGWGMNWSAGRK